MSLLCTPSKNTRLLSTQERHNGRSLIHRFVLCLCYSVGMWCVSALSFYLAVKPTVTNSIRSRSPQLCIWCLSVPWRRVNADKDSLSLCLTWITSYSSKKSRHVKHLMAILSKRYFVKMTHWLISSSYSPLRQQSLSGEVFFYSWIVVLIVSLFLAPKGRESLSNPPATLTLDCF